MKTIFSLALIAGTAAAGSLIASAVTVDSFKAAPSRELNLPLAPDSSQTENKWAAEKLLSARLPIGLTDQLQNWTTMQTDTAGRLTFVKDAVKPRIHTLLTSLRPQRFTKGKLVLSTNALADVLVNGSSVIKKTSTDTVASPSEYAISMNPEADYLVQINLVSLPEENNEPEVKLEFIPDKEFEDVVIYSGADLKRRFSVKTTSDGPRATFVDLSADGKYTLVRYANTYNADETARYSALMETATGKVLTSDLPEGCFWLPKVSAFGYTQKENGKYNLYRMDLPSMKRSLMAKGLPDNSFTLSPDGKYIFYYEEAKGKKEEGDMRRVTGPDDRIPGNRDRMYILRYDIENGVSQYLTYGGASTYIADFSRDGKKMLYTSSVNDPKRFPFYFTDIIEMDLTTLRNDTLVKGDPSINNAVYSPDGKRLFIAGGPGAFGNLGKNAGNHEIANEFDVQGYIFDLATRKAEFVTKDFAPSITASSVIWNPKDNMIYFRATEGFFTPIYSFNPKNGEFRKLPTKVDTATSYSVGEQEDQWLGYVGQSFTNAGTVYVMNLRNGESRLLDDPMKDYLAGVEMGEMQPWSFTASDGTVIEGEVCLPPNFDPEKKYPLIVYYYGGTTPSSSTMHHPYTPQVFASRDYVVYVVNPSGTIGYGQEFSARHVNTWGQRTADDIIEGVKEFCRTHPFVNDKKIGCLGASYGGFMTQYLQTKTDIFAAAVSHAGISNVTSYWGEGFWGYSYNAVAAAQSYPWSNPELFTKQGSLFNADKIHTPLLLLHGSRDTNVPIGESIQLFNALRVLGRDVEFITVDDQDHIITDYNKKQIWQNTIMAWFAKYLQDDSRWWNSMYGK